MEKSNRRIIKIITIAAILVSLASMAYVAISRNGLFVITSSGDFAVYQNVDEMTSGATDIVRAIILDERVEELNILLPPPGGPNDWYLSRREDFYRIHTIHRIEILEVFRGDAQTGDIMEIAQMGGRIGLSSYRNQNRLDFITGDDVILFMRTFRESHGDYGPAVLLAGGQGVFHATSSTSSRSNDFVDGIGFAYEENPMVVDVVFESFSPYMRVPLTIGDLMLIRYEAGLGPRPHNLQPPVGVDRDRLNEAIAMAKFYLSHNYTRSGWDEVQNLLEEAIRVRDNIYSRQIHVNPASTRLRREMRNLGIDINAPISTPVPTSPQQTSGLQ